MEFLDNGATCNNSLASKRTLLFSDKHIHHTIYTRRFESYYFPPYLWNKRVVFETSCVYCGACVFMTLKKASLLTSDALECVSWFEILK